MKRKDFLKGIGIIGASAAFNNVFGFDFNFHNPTPKGIFLPGSHSTIKELSTDLKKNADILRYIKLSFESFKAANIAQSNRIESIMKRYHELPEKFRNGWNGSNIDYNIKEAMDNNSKRSSAPVIRHMSLATTFDKIDECDLSDKTPSDDGSIFVTPLDKRTDKNTYETDENFSYLIFNPKYSCIGLPSSPIYKVTIDSNLKKKIYNSTHMETSVSVYRYQDFTYMGSGICGPDGKLGGATTRTIYSGTDSALDKYHGGLVPVTGCADLSRPTCPLKA
jgi:hypothetical protein